MGDLTRLIVGANEKRAKFVVHEQLDRIRRRIDPERARREHAFLPFAVHANFSAGFLRGDAADNAGR